MQECILTSEVEYVIEAEYNTHLNTVDNLWLVVSQCFLAMETTWKNAGGFVDGRTIVG